MSFKTAQTTVAKSPSAITKYAKKGATHSAINDFFFRNRATLSKFYMAYKSDGRGASSKENPKVSESMLLKKGLILEKCMVEGGK